MSNVTSRIPGKNRRAVGRDLRDRAHTKCLSYGEIKKFGEGQVCLIRVRLHLSEFLNVVFEPIAHLTFVEFIPPVVLHISKLWLKVRKHCLVALSSWLVEINHKFGIVFRSDCLNDA